MSGWLIEEVSGLYVVTAPGCHLVGHPEFSACDCAAFLTRTGAESYVDADGYPTVQKRKRKTREQKEREHAEWLAWRKTRDTHRCEQCELTSTLHGIKIHQRRSGHAGISKLESAPA